MAECNPSDLLNDGLAGLGTHELAIIKTQLLREWADLDMSAQELMQVAAASCILCLGDKDLMSIQTQLLCERSTS